MKKMLIIILSVMEIISIFLFVKSFNSKEVILDDVKLKNEISNKKSYALWIQQANGEYIESQSNIFPTEGYHFNSQKSGCIDDDGNLIANSLHYEDNNVKLSTNKSAYCYVYFDISN